MPHRVSTERAKSGGRPTPGDFCRISAARLAAYFRGLEQPLASSLLDLRNGLRNSGFPPVPAAQNRQFRAESGAVRGVARMLLKSLVERQTT